MRKSAIALVIAVITSTPAIAIEGSIELSTGGLIFVRNENLDVLSEDLAISPSEVSIRYRLFNKSDSAVTVLVAFPMPDIHIEGRDDSLSVPTEDAVNLLAFATKVNGEAVSAAVEQRVIAAGIDRTQLLRGLGIALAPHLSSTHAELDQLPPDKWEELRRVGLAEIEQYDTGGGMQKHLGPRWALQTTFFWEQTFAARAETVIEHRYKPSVGRSGQTLLGSPNEAKEPWYDEYKDKYCFSYEFLAAVERARKGANSKFGAPFSERRIEYARKTWVNGLGSPIKDFRLTVDKGAADNLVSLCGEEARNISETQLEVTKADYAPDGSLNILFLDKLPPQ
jgi:hypothetical protein